ncbi:unnamed protein product [Rotaria sp. Silwood2]|nr:unnamed protein product [Rotaria sp. Silwood2]
MWFNVGHPNSSTSTDMEDMNIILAQNPTSMCPVPFSIEAQSVNTRISSYSVQWIWSQPNNTLYLLSFQSVAPVGVDFRVRYCCPAGSFVTPITTTTPMPFDSITCGKQAIAPRLNLMNRIFGGTDAIPNSWPWMIYYQEEKLCGTNLCYGVCGGTLISGDYVLTAAHCIGTNNPSNIILTAGMHNLLSTTETSMRQVSTVRAIYIHPQYDPTLFINDIAVLHVTTPFTFTQYVQPACLPGAEPQPDDQIVGMCERWWSFVDSSRQICVADRINGSSACQGDSGGPILSQYQGQYVVSGIASYTRDCNTAGAENPPNVYTRVAAYKTWIKGITG